MKLVGITGASGFVGRNLYSYLRKEQLGLAKITRGNLENPAELNLNEIDVVVHLAGKAHALKTTPDEKEYFRVNFKLTKDLYDSFLASQAKKFIFISSVKAVADTIKGELLESHNPDPLTIYGKSKLMAENYIRSCNLPNGKSYYILRPCMIHGPGNKGNLNLLYKAVKRGIPYLLAAFVNKRSYLSVENLCFVISELISRDDIDSGVYHISDDNALSTNEVIEILSESLAKKPRLWYVSPFLIKCLSRIGDKFRLPLTTERLEKLTESYVVSNKKLTKALNKPLPVSVREGLKLTATSFQTQNN